jgi:FkbM family methyltransferase
MTFLDVGAHLGYFTLLASWLVGESGHVHSFEPTFNTFKLLQMNSESKPNIHVNCAAVTSGRGTAILNDYGPSLSAFNSIYDAKLPDQAGQAKADRLVVETISIDQYVREQNLAPNFVKIDAENADYEILTGMKETLSKFRPVISVEVDDMDIAGVPLSKDIVRFLVDRGYQPFKNRYQHGDLFFLPQT